MLDINPLSFISFANIFSHSFHFVDGFLCRVKALSLIRSHLLIFASVSFALEEGSKKIISAIYVKECSTYVSL